jgi:hypothetical protein
MKTVDVSRNPVENSLDVVYHDEAEMLTTIEDMPISGKEWELIEAKIRDATNPRWHPLRLLKDYGVVGAAITVAVMLVMQNGQFRGSTEERLRHLEEGQKDLNGKVDLLLRAQPQQRVLNELYKLDEPAFVKSLATLQAVTDQQPVDIEPEIVTSLAQKLSATRTTAPGYWPAVLQFLRFASAKNAPDAPPPGPSTLWSNNSTRGEAFKGSRITLDGGVLEDVVFEHCRITLTNNPVKMRNVRFINCVFELPVTASPSKFLMLASKQLLAQAGSGTTVIQDL